MCLVTSFCFFVIQDLSALCRVTESKHSALVQLCAVPASRRHDSPVYMASKSSLADGHPTHRVAKSIRIHSCHPSFKVHRILLLTQPWIQTHKLSSQPWASCRSSADAVRHQANLEREIEILIPPGIGVLFDYMRRRAKEKSNPYVL